VVIVGSLGAHMSLVCSGSAAYVEAAEQGRRPCEGALSVAR